MPECPADCAAMLLHLLRHGRAVETGTAGFERDVVRPLTADGRQRVKAVAEGMRVLGLKFDLVLSSPAVRARETADLVVQHLRCRRRVVERAELGITAEPRDVVLFLAGLRPVPASILLVGHEPYLGRLLSLLVSGAPDLAIPLRKAGLARLSTQHLLAGRCASLDWLLTARQLARIGQSDR